jgi:hypothetical protein
MTARIPPIDPPYADDVRAALDKWMPPGVGVEPLRLFRTLERHHDLADRLRGVGALFLGRRARAPTRLRELLVLRTCARAGAEYEWGVHVSAFAAATGLDEAIVRSTVLAAPSDLRRADVDDDHLALRLADELHDGANVGADLWSLLVARFDHAVILEMIAIVGFYRLVSTMTNALAIEHEPWAARFPT